MDRLVAWLWRRYRHHPLVIVMLVGSIIAIVGLAIPSTVVVGLFLGLSRANTIRWSIEASTATVVGLFFSAVTVVRVARPAVAWAKGDTSDPVAAWRSFLAFPRAVTIRAGFVVLAVHLVTTFPYAVYLAHLRSILYLAVLASGIVAVIFAGALVVGNSMVLLARPAVDEISAVLPLDTPLEVQTWSISTRFLASTVATTFVSGLGTAGVALGTRATMHDYTVTVLTSAALMVIVSALVYLGITHPSSVSLHYLIDATHRVRRGDFTRPVHTTVPDETGELAAAFNQMQAGLRERASLQAAFESYVDPTLAQRLLRQDNAVFDGEDVEVTVFFVDVRDFTAYSETAGAIEAVARLNRLFEVVVPVIVDAGGHANHFLGDGVLAVFGVPLPLADHADKALAAAVEIQRRVSAEFGEGLRIGIGVNTGHVIAGTIGGGGRLEFTVIGDVVNVASRVEKMTKDFGDAILVTDATIAALRDPVDMYDRGELEVRGRRSRQRLFAVDPF